MENARLGVFKSFIEYDDKVIMKVIIVLLFVVLFVGCNEKKEPSNECFFLDEAKKCVFKISRLRSPSCLLRAFGYMTVIGTRYEYLLDRVEYGELTAYFEKQEKQEGTTTEQEGTTTEQEESETIADISPLFDIISKADKQNLSFNFYEKHNELFDREDSVEDTLIKFRKHYKCPAPEI